MIILSWLLLNKIADGSNHACDLPFIKNGQCESVGDYIHVKCGVGYKLTGTSQIPCQPRKDNYSNLPSCEPIPCPLPLSANDIIPDFVDNNVSYIRPNHQVELNCKSDYIAPTHKTTCITNSTFSEWPLPVCQTRSCVHNAIKNGQITSQHLAPNTKVLIECDEGFKRDERLSDIICISHTLFSEDLNAVCQAVPCAAPDIPNGYSLSNITQPGKELRYSCDSNYDKDLQPVYCKSGHKFLDDTAPKCEPKNCPARNVENGQLMLAEPRETVNILCNEGYEMEKDIQLTCISNNVFYPEELPRCREKSCIPPNIANGEKIDFDNSESILHGSSITIKCGANYRQNGASIIFCNKGEYRPSVPTCDAMPCHLPLSKLSHVQYLNEIQVYPEKKNYELRAGSVIQVICNESYSLNNLTVVTCISQNIFDPPLLPKCIPVNCNEKPNILNGMVTSEFPLSPNRTLTIQCDAGYKLSHQITPKCFSKRTFVPPLPECLPLPCPEFAIQNGTVRHSGGTIQPGQSVLVSCDDNFELIGSARVTCVAGESTSTKPTCKPRNCTGFTITHGEVVSAGPDRKMQVRCDEGYQLVGRLMTCLAGRARSGDISACSPQPCPGQHVDHGTVTPGTSVEPGERVRVSCDRDYHPSHSYHVTCVTQNTFFQLLPRCLPSNCAVEKVENSTNLHIRSYKPGEAIEIVCKRGYRKNYDNIVRCVAGSQTVPAALPTCHAQPCKLPGIQYSDVTSQRQLAPGAQVTVTCNRGYRISSSSVVECVTDDTFKSSLPSCIAIPCPKPSSRIPNGRVLNTGNNIQPGARLHIQCDPDYTISYEQHVTCVTSDIFHPSLPSCNDRECSVPYIRNGRVTSPATSGSVSPDTMISISCDVGYDLIGSNRVQCVRANTFLPDLSTVSCRARPCLLTSAPHHGTFTTSRAEPGYVISLSCDPNYQLSFSDPVYCVTDSQYRVRGESGALPTCLPLPCPAPRVENGAALGPVTPGEPLTVSCSTGYVISSQQSVSCVAGQIFSPQLPQCQAQPCPVPRAILHSLPSTVSHVQPGDLLQITCDPNYQLHNPSHSVKCVTLSRFSNSLPTCRATNCRLPSVPHGQWSDGTLTPGQSGQLECTTGYTGTGTSQLVRCISGNKLDPGTLDFACVENCQVDAQIVSNGYLEPETSEPVRPGAKVRVRCNPGFEHVVKSEEVLTCVTGTNFQPAAVRGCRAVPCRVPGGPQHGRYTTSRTTLQPGDKLTVTCEAGYHVTGPRAVTCVTAEIFSGDIPACRPRPCPVPTIINGTALHGSPVVQPDQKLEYRCMSGYYNDQVKNVFCKTENQFTAPIPVCKPVSCGAPTIRYGRAAGSTPPGGRVNITCGPGLELQPPDPVFCVTETIFFPSSLPQCKAVPCTRPLDLQNGHILNIDMIQPGEEVQIECSPEYMISSDKRVACISGDVYTSGSVHTLGTLPQCAPMPCEKPVVENGVIETAGPIKPGDEVVVTCGADYRITGPGYLVCTSGAQFKYRNQTLCEPMECVAPEIAHGRLSSPTLSPGQVVSIQCDLGYKPDCHVPITCVSADNFQPVKLPQCLPQQCKKPVIRDGIVTGPTPLIPNNTLIVQCETGHTLTSVVPITCVTLEEYDPPLLPHCAPVSNCTVPHISNGGYIGKLPSMISPGATLRYTCNNKGSYVPLFGPEVTCLTGQYFHPSPPICVAQDQVQSARLNYSRATISIRDFEKVEITTPTEASNPPSKVVGALVAVIVVIALIVVLLVFLLRNKEYKQKLMKVLGGSTYLNKYRPVKAVRKDAEQGTKPPTIKKKTPPVKPPPPKLPPSGPYKPSLTNTPSRPAKSGGSKSQTPKKPTLYPHLSETSSEVLTQTKNNTDTELSAYPVYKPKPSKPGKLDQPTMKPVAVSDLRQGGKRNARSAFTAPRSAFTAPRSAFTRTPSSLTRPATETSCSTDSVSNIDSMDSESYEQLLNDMGLSKEDFRARIPRSRYMPEDYL